MIKISNKKVVLVQSSVLGYPMATSEQSLMENSLKTTNDLQTWLCSPVKLGNAELQCGVESLVPGSSRVLVLTGAAAFLRALCVHGHPCGFPGTRGLWGTQRRRGGHGRSCARMRCCRCQSGRKELVAVSGVAGKSVLCLSVKLINRSGFSSLLTDRKPSKYWSKIGFFDVCLHFLLKETSAVLQKDILTSKLHAAGLECISHHSNLGEW